MTPTGHLDTEACYRAVQSRDRRFDGVFYTAVRTTGIYCRPSCPARPPSAANVTVHAAAAAGRGVPAPRRRRQCAGGHMWTEPLLSAHARMVRLLP